MPLYSYVMNVMILNRYMNFSLHIEWKSGSEIVNSSDISVAAHVQRAELVSRSQLRPHPDSLTCLSTGCSAGTRGAEADCSQRVSGVFPDWKGKSRTTRSSANQHILVIGDKQS